MIKLLILDIDGCLTDGGYFSPSVPSMSCGDTKVADLTPQLYFRKFNTSDFVGIKMLSDAGIRCMVLTGSYEPSMPQFERAGREIEVCSGVQDKSEYVRINFVDHPRAEEALKWDEIAFIGDEINDCSLLAKVGLGACPADASREVIALIEGKTFGEGFVMSRKGGELCVREFTDMIRDLMGIKASWCNWEEE